MKSVVAMLLLVAALAWADSSYDNFQTYQNHHDQTSSPSSNYYEQQGQPTRRVGSGLTGFLQQYLSPIRRTGLAAISGFLVPVLFIAFLFFIALIVYGYYSALFNSSGRGLDTDEWEVDHSVWMDQLQKDFEESWAEH